MEMAPLAISSQQFQGCEFAELVLQCSALRGKIRELKFAVVLGPGCFSDCHFPNVMRHGDFLAHTLRFVVVRLVVLSMYP